jgi:hypothetical protein
VKEPPVAFLPSLGSLTPELFAVVLTNKGMRIQMPTILRIFASEEFCSS